MPQKHSFIKAQELLTQAKLLETSDLPKAIDLIEQAIGLFKESQCRNEELDTIIYLSRLHRLAGNGNFSLRHLNQAIQIINTDFSDEPERLAYVYREISVVYADIFHQLPTALEYCYKALNYKLPDLEAILYNNIGSIYKDSFDFENAIYYLEKGKISAEKENRSISLMYILENLGRVYLAQGKNEKALELFFEGLNVSKKEFKKKNQNRDFITCLTLLAISNTYLALSDFENANSYGDKVINLAKRQGFKTLYIEAIENKALLHLKSGDEEEFLTIIDEAISFCEENKFYKFLNKNLTHLQQYHENKNQFQSALLAAKRIHENIKQNQIQNDQENLSRIIENRESEIFRLEEKNMQINRQKEELEQFAYIVTHDLKGPLINIENYGNLISKKYISLLDEQGRNFVNFIQKDSNRLQKMLDDLLEYIRLEDTKGQQIANPNKILDDIQDSLREKIEQSNAKLDYVSLPKIPMREIHLHIILNNLIKNALKFQKNGTPPLIKVSAQDKTNEFIFEIEDNGIGIKKEFQHQIFQIFKRLDNINYEGNGIGLSMCKKIINMYNGKIWLDSIPDVGSKFYFSINKQLS